MKLTGHFSNIILLALVLVGCASAPAIQMGPDARVNAEGLHFIENTASDEAWIKPGTDFSTYSKLMVVGSGPSFKGEQSAERTAKFAELASSAFRTALADLQGFELTDQAGPGVLLLKGSIENIELYEEPNRMGRSAVFVRELGSAQLVLDLRDSQTGEPILLAKDTATLGNQAGAMQRATDQTAWVAVRSQLSIWANRLRDRLEELASYNLSSAG